MTSPVGRGPLIQTLAAILVVGALGWLDYVTGPDVGFSLFYIMPIGVVAWRSGRSAAFSVAATATAAWMVADLAWHARDDWEITVWNGFTRLVIYFFVAVTVSSMHAYRVTLAENNRRLRELLDKTETMARTDALTGLMNSRAFFERVAAELPRTPGSGRQLCLAYFDLDNFKQVNDRYGHAAGDEALRDVAVVLRAGVREADLVARLGGDELAVVLWDTSAAEAEHVVRRIVGEVLAAGLARWPAAGLGASVGLAHVTQASIDVDAMIRAADEAMYRAKKGGKGTVVSIALDEAVATA